MTVSPFLPIVSSNHKLLIHLFHFSTLVFAQTTTGSSRRNKSFLKAFVPTLYRPLSLIEVGGCCQSKHQTRISIHTSLWKATIYPVVPPQSFSLSIHITLGKTCIKKVYLFLKKPFCKILSKSDGSGGWPGHMGCCISILAFLRTTTFS